MGNFTSAVFNQPLSGFCAGQLSTNRQVCVSMRVFDSVCERERPCVILENKALSAFVHGTAHAIQTAQTHSLYVVVDDIPIEHNVFRNSKI